MKLFLASCFLLSVLGVRHVKEAGVSKNGDHGEQENSCVNFMIIGDFGSQRTAQGRVRDSMAAEAAQVSADAILALGDNIYEDGAASTGQMVREWQDIYMTRSALRRPWYAVMGNHDWRSDGYIMRNFTTSSRSLGHWNMPHFWHKKRFGNVEVFFVDTQVWRGSVSSMSSRISEQRQWLESSLSGSSAAWKIVVGHHPTYSAGSHGGSSSMKRELDPIMRKYGATIYFAGHDHSQQHMAFDGVNYVVSGAGAKSPRGESGDYPSGSLKKFQKEPGFASLRICDDQSGTLKFFTQSGSVTHQATLRNENPGGGDGGGDPVDERRRRRRRRRRRDDPAALVEDDGAQARQAPSVTFAEEAVAEQQTEARRGTGRTLWSTRAICKGVQLKPVDMRCSSDGCRVQPDTDSSKISCSMYCAEHGLTCAGAWSNKFEDCGLDEITSCESLLPRTDPAIQVCECA